MNQENRDKFKEYAKANSPNESCAVLFIKQGKEEIFLCNNVALDKRRNFIIDPLDYEAAENEGEIVAVVHSHVGSPQPSQVDLVSCETTKLKWLIYSINLDVWHEFFPSGYRAPLVGRQFHFGVLDCFTLIRDYYRAELGLELRDFERTDESIFKTESLYEKHFESYGFKRVTELQKNDVILMQIGYKNPSHAAIYLGEGLMLHHLRNKLSSRDVYGGFWAKNTRFFCRYFG
jgi:proteasome lid subunit RPN8/RPN11